MQSSICFSCWIECLPSCFARQHSSCSLKNRLSTDHRLVLPKNSCEDFSISGLCPGLVAFASTHSAFMAMSARTRPYFSSHHHDETIFFSLVSQTVILSVCNVSFIDRIRGFAAWVYSHWRWAFKFRPLEYYPSIILRCQCLSQVINLSLNKCWLIKYIQLS